MNTTPALHFRAVNKSFGDLRALDDVNLRIERGEFVALLGHNGAGKTTLINCLSGITRVDSGSITVNGVLTDDDPVVAKTAVGIMAQEVTFDPFFTPMEVLRMQRGLYGLAPDEKYLRWLLEQLALADKMEVGGRNLSGGMKRRLMLAKALAHKPEILILDEPTAGVDVQLRKQLWQLLQNLRAEHGLTIVLTTHYLEEAEQLADRVVMINHGRIVLDSPKTKLLADCPRTLTITHRDGSSKTHTITQSDSLRELILAEKNIADIAISEPKLEDIFLKVAT